MTPRFAIAAPFLGAALAILVGRVVTAPENDGGAVPPIPEEAPVRAAYEALRAAEERHERRLEEAADPVAAGRFRQKGLDDAITSGDRSRLVSVGRDLFLRDVPREKRRVAASETTRCASCHSRGGPGGAGGLVDNFFEDRNPPALGGAALLERLAAEMTADLKASSGRGGVLVAKGLSFGSAGAPRGVASDLVIRPFGRGRWGSLDEAIAAMGTRSLGVEMSPSERTAIAAFVASLPEPGLFPPDPVLGLDLYQAWSRGRRTFDQIGCASCHVPELRLADGTPVRAFTDLRTHDLGAGLAGNHGREWLTAPLWGLSDSAPWLHDGRALASLDDAILAHGGEAELVRERYRGLPDGRKGDLRVFLLSLARQPRIQIAGE